MKNHQNSKTQDVKKSSDAIPSETMDFSSLRKHQTAAIKIANVSSSSNLNVGVNVRANLQTQATGSAENNEKRE